MKKVSTYSSTDYLPTKPALLDTSASIFYAGCFPFVFAIVDKAVIAAGDPEFEKVEHLVEIFWV